MSASMRQEEGFQRSKNTQLKEEIPLINVFVEKDTAFPEGRICVDWKNPLETIEEGLVCAYSPDELVHLHQNCSLKKLKIDQGFTWILLTEQLGNDVLIHIGSFLETTCLFKYLSTCKYLWKLKDIPAFKSRLEEFQTVLQSFRHNDNKSWIPYIEKHLNIDVKTIVDHFRSDIEFLRKTNIDDQQLQKACERCLVIQWRRGLESAVRYRNNELIQYFMELDNQNWTAEDWNWGMYNAASGGHRDLVELFIHKGAYDWNEGMCSAASGGHRDLVELFIEKGADNWNRGLERAVEEGHRDLVELFIEKGANHWFTGLDRAASGGHRDLVELFIQKGAYYSNSGLAKAIERGHRDLVELFIENGADDWNWAMCSAASGGHRDLVELFIEKGADSWHEGLERAVSGGHRDVVELFIEKGVDYWNEGMYFAALEGHRDLVELFIHKGADAWNTGLMNAFHGRHKDLVEFFIQKGASLENALDYCFDDLKNDLELTKILFKQGRFKRETRDRLLKHTQDFLSKPSYQLIAIYCFVKQQNFTE